MSAGLPRRFASLLALALVLGSVGSAASARPAAAWDAGVPDATSEALLTSLTNESRTDEGLRTLSIDQDLVRIARWRSADMAERGYFSHDIPPRGTKVFNELSERGYCYVVAGENIGWL
ncbi:MAG TPA: CAP domain-containing protein, partial [Candidatus Limnocylindrales bacterium]|nr:CAP domain-containing protein [Candidatus Limnocylindrales bacterium]